MGLVMLYALVGKPLIHANSRSKLIALHQDPPQPDFDKINGLTPAGRSLLEDCLQVDPAKRLSSASALVERLTACAEEDPQEQSRQRRSHASIALVATIFGVVIGMGTVVYYFLDLLERQNLAETPVVKYASPQIDFGEESEQAPPEISPVSKADQVAPATSRFASLKDAKVPWPQVPELIDRRNSNLSAASTERCITCPVPIAAG